MVRNIFIWRRFQPPSSPPDSKAIYASLDTADQKKKVALTAVMRKLIILMILLTRFLHKTACSSPRTRK